MSYDLHITRNPDWQDHPAETISARDWLEYVKQDADMRADGFAEAPMQDGSVLRMEDGGIAVWTAYSGHDENGNKAWFRHFEDRVSVSNPDREIRIKMFEIATALHASLQGDDGELYDAHGDALPEPGAARNGGGAERKPWWRFW